MDRYKIAVYVAFGIAVLMYTVANLLPDEDNFKIENGKIITGVFQNYVVHKSMNKGYVDYYYKGKYFEHNKSELGCYCYRQGQTILIKIDSLNPEKFIFIPDTFYLTDTPMDEMIIGEDYLVDTLEAFDLDYFPMTQCLKFKIKYDGRITERHKLYRTKPISDTMNFIYFNRNIDENIVKEK